MSLKKLIFAVLFKKLLSDQDFMIVIHCYFLSVKVLLQGGYDVIVISPPEGASGNYS